MTHECEGVKAFKQWIVKRNELPLRNNNSDKQFKLECKKTNLNCLSEFKKISEIIIKWIKNRDITIDTDEINIEYINLYIKIVLNINDFNNFEISSSYIHDDLDTEEQPLWYVVDFKLNIIKLELLKRENKKKEKENKKKEKENKKKEKENKKKEKENKKEKLE